MQKADIKLVFRHLDEDPEEVVRIYSGFNEHQFADTAVFSAVGMACYSFNTTIILTKAGNENAMVQKVIDVCRMASVRIKNIVGNIITVKDIDGDPVDVCVWPIDQIEGAVEVSYTDSLFNFFVTGEQTEEQIRLVEELGKHIPTFYFIEQRI